MDISNFQGKLTPWQVQALRDSGYSFLIAGAQEPAITRQQLTIAHEGGLEIEAYTYFYWDNVEKYIQRTIEACQGIPIKQLWIDCESAIYSFTQAEILVKIHQAVNVLGNMWPIGIYTSPNWWHNVLGNPSDFKDLPLWHAHYDNVPDFTDWPLIGYGGWDSIHTKQYSENINVGGVSCDLNVRTA